MGARPLTSLSRSLFIPASVCVLVWPVDKADRVMRSGVVGALKVITPAETLHIERPACGKGRSCGAERNAMKGEGRDWASLRGAIKVSPPEGTTLAKVEAVGVELDLTRCKGADPFSLQLFVDGKDVTSQSKITTTRDLPPSEVSIYYAPIGIKAGRHLAEIRFRQNKSDAVCQYRWCFTVAE
jgi:hypothetical protein